MIIARPALTLILASEKRNVRSIYFSAGLLIRRPLKLKHLNQLLQGTYLAVACVAGIHLLRIVRPAVAQADSTSVRAIPLQLVAIREQPSQRTLVQLLFPSS